MSPMFTMMQPGLEGQGSHLSTCTLTEPDFDLFSHLPRMAAILTGQAKLSTVTAQGHRAEAAQLHLKQISAVC